MSQQRGGNPQQPQQKASGQTASPGRASSSNPHEVSNFSDEAPRTATSPGGIPLPRTQTLGGTPIVRTSSSTGVPVPRSSAAGPVPAQTATRAAAGPIPGQTATRPTAPGSPRPTSPSGVKMNSQLKQPSVEDIATSVMTQHQKGMLGSNFNEGSRERRREALLQTSTPSVVTKPRTGGTSKVQRFDGTSIPEALTNRDVWKAVQPRAMSYAGKRSRDAYRSVVNQFGVLTNPRYDEDGPGKVRGHIFVWDVSRAMDCEIPHFVGAKELSLSQTLDWLRHEGPMRGWKRVSDADIIDRANKGHLVVALPKELKIRQLAIVLPQDPPMDGMPRLTGVCAKRAQNVTARELFGARPLECFFHD